MSGLLPTPPYAVVQSADLRQLVRPTLRSMPWGQLSAGGVLAVLLVLATAGTTDLSVYEVVIRIRVAAVLLAVGTAGVLDDPTRPDLDGTPVPLAVRRGLRAAIAVGVVALCWVLIILAAAHHPAILGTGASGRQLPVQDLSIFLAAMVLVTLATAALVTRRAGGSGAIAAAATALGLPMLAATAPRLLAQWTSWDLTMFPTGAAPPPLDESGSPSVDPAWVAAHQRWLALAVAATLVLLVALPGRPARLFGARRALSDRREPDARRPASTAVSQGSRQR